MGDRKKEKGEKFKGSYEGGSRIARCDGVLVW